MCAAGHDGGAGGRNGGAGGHNGGAGGHNGGAGGPRLQSCLSPSLPPSPPPSLSLLPNLLRPQLQAHVNRDRVR